ncbi:MAG TPA: type II toxin-antitoxin system PemK/MazF family toxin [Polyangiaceae bacterium]|nr:type II toxin-antitoxin system PemK/MazF family toxin [Polyangiaceae bacterium]
MKRLRGKKRLSEQGRIELAPAVDIRRGDIFWICCDPLIGAEPRKTRTCVVVSNDVANQYGRAITVVPTQEFTSERAARGYMVDLRRPRSTLEAPRVANASMIMTYDRARVTSRAGRVAPDTLRGIERALCLHLGIAPAQERT